MFIIFILVMLSRLYDSKRIKFYSKYVQFIAVNLDIRDTVKNS